MVGVDIIRALRSGGETEVHGWFEMVEDGSPGAFFVSRAPVALVDNDEVEEILGVFLVVATDIFPLGDGLVDGKKEVGVGRRYAVAPSHFLAVDLDQVAFVGVKGVDGLVGQHVAIASVAA